MKNPLVQEILDETPEDVRIFTSWYADLMVRIHDLMEKNGWSQKYLAGQLGKTPPEISRWFSGDYNFTLRSLAKLEAELGEPLLYIPQTVKVHSFYNTKFNSNKKSHLGDEGYRSKVELSESEIEFEKIA